MPKRSLHPSARTTRKIRRLIQTGHETDRAKAAKFAVDVKTVAKWRKRTSVEDAPRGPVRDPRESLNPDREAFLIAVRKLTRASLEDMITRLKRRWPWLSRSELYRCWKRWGVSKSPTILPRNWPSLEEGQLRFFIYAYRKEGHEKWILLTLAANRVDAEFTESSKAPLYNFLTRCIEAQPSPVTGLQTPNYDAFYEGDELKLPMQQLLQYCEGKGIAVEAPTEAKVAVPLLTRGWRGLQPDAG